MSELIRTRKRTVTHPLGQPLLCALPICQNHATTGHTRYVNDVLWPFCSEQHANDMPWSEIIPATPPS